jgi:hypothetical protein
MALAELHSQEGEPPKGSTPTCMCCGHSINRIWEAEAREAGEECEGIVVIYNPQGRMTLCEVCSRKIMTGARDLREALRPECKGELV